MRTQTRCTAEEFVKAFQSILESLEETSKRDDEKASTSRELTPEQLESVHALHGLVSKHDLSQIGTTEALLSLEGFITEWEESRQVSGAVQQLVSLLQRPHTRGLLQAYDDIVSHRFGPSLPPIPFEVDEDDGVAVKIVRLVKRDEPLGATIKTDSQGRVTIARIIAGGVADRSACIQEGDRVVEVNGVAVAGLDPPTIVGLLNNTENGTVTFKLIPAAAPVSNDIDQEHIHLRAQFDYNGREDPLHPCPEAALSFRKGDILELLVCKDEHWWQARRLGTGSLAVGDDVFPMEESDPIGMGFTQGIGVLGVGLIPSELMEQKRRAALGFARPKSDRTSQASTPTDSSLIYESVCRLVPKPESSRPIVLIGPPGVGRNELKRRLLMAFPDKYATTVPHTTRPPRPHEVEGVDYHFVSHAQMEAWIQRGEMIEFGEYRGNLYGTRAAAVMWAAREGRQPLLCTHPLALRVLRTSHFRPIIIFIQPPDVEAFKETRAALRARSSRGGGSLGAYPRAFTDAEVESIVAQGKQMHNTFGHIFDAHIVNGNLELAFGQLVRLLHKFETQPSWVPTSWADPPVEEKH